MNSKQLTPQKLKGRHSAVNTDKQNTNTHTRSCNTKYIEILDLPVNKLTESTSPKDLRVHVNLEKQEFQFPYESNKSANIFAF